jgi:hypothetical protein
VTALVGERADSQGVDRADAGGDDADVAGNTRVPGSRDLAGGDDELRGLEAVDTTQAVDREAECGDLRLDGGADGCGATDDGDRRGAVGTQSRQGGARARSEPSLRRQQDRSPTDTGEEAGAEGVGRTAVLATGDDHVGDIGGGVESSRREGRGLVAVSTRDALEGEASCSGCRRSGNDSAREREGTGENASCRAPHGVPVEVTQLKSLLLDEMAEPCGPDLSCERGVTAGRTLLSAMEPSLGPRRRETYTPPWSHGSLSLLSSR